MAIMAVVTVVGSTLVLYQGNTCSSHHQHCSSNTGMRRHRRHHRRRYCLCVHATRV